MERKQQPKDSVIQKDHDENESPIACMSTKVYKHRKITRLLS